MLGMASPIAALFREIIDRAHCDIETLELHKRAEGAEATAQAEVAAIERVQAVLRSSIKSPKTELST